MQRHEKKLKLFLKEYTENFPLSLYFGTSSKARMIYVFSRRPIQAHKAAQCLFFFFNLYRETPYVLHSLSVNPN